MIIIFPSLNCLGRQTSGLYLLWGFSLNYFSYSQERGNRAELYEGGRVVYWKDCRQQKPSWPGKEKDVSVSLENGKAKQGISSRGLHLTILSCLRRQNKKKCSSFCRFHLSAWTQLFQEWECEGPCHYLPSSYEMTKLKSRLWNDEVKDPSWNLICRSQG